MRLFKKTIIAALFGTALLTSQASLASTGCYMGDTDGSEWLESVVVPETPLFIDYNSSSWDQVEAVNFDFGHQRVDNPRGFTLRVQLAEPTTEAMTLWGRLEGESGASGSSNMEGRIELYTNLNNERYFSRLTEGKIHLGIGRTGSNERIEVVKMTARFCGIPVVEGISVSAAENNVLGNYGQVLTHYIDADTTYRVSASGEASDEMGNSISTVALNYIDGRNAENRTVQLGTSEEQYIHSEGTVNLFYAIDSKSNTGGHSVKFERVNLD